MVPPQTKYMWRFELFHGVLRIKRPLRAHHVKNDLSAKAKKVKIDHHERV